MSIYAVGSLGAPDNKINFNVYTQDPVYRVLSRAPQKWQIRQQDLPVPFESGSSDFLTLLGDTAYIIQGVMYPGNENSYDAGLMALRTVASLDITQADALSNSGFVPYTWGNANSAQQQVFVKPLYCQLVETTKQGFVQPFTIYCKIIDPAIYGGTLKTASTGQSNTAHTTGSAQYPFKYPVVFGATLFDVSADCDNAGTLATYPASIQVTGPVTNPKVINAKTGEYLECDVTLNSTADHLSFTYSKTRRQVLLNGVNVAQHVSAGSTFFKIQPGNNVIELSGQSIGNGAFATVSYMDAYPLA